jgi:hypothetical protein
MKVIVYSLLLSLLLSSYCLAEQRLDLEGTAILGNKESPNILYVAPWSIAEPPSPLEPSRNNLLDQMLVPLDREVFLREIDWQQKFLKKE